MAGTTAFPGAIDGNTNLPQPGSGTLTNNPSHAGLHNNEVVAIIATETKIGTGATTAAANQLLVGTGSGASTWQGLTSAQLLAIISDETGSGKLVFATSPTLTTPVIASIVNTGTLTLPTSSDTLVGRATTDTLTNKSISGSTNTLTNIPISAIATTSGAWTAYTPAWTATGTAPAIGNGTIVGKSLQIGKIVFFRITVTFGSTSTYGTGSYRFSLPTTATETALSLSLMIGQWGAVHAATNYGGGCELVSTTTIGGLIPSITTAGQWGGEVAQTAPVTWASTDTINFRGFYEAV